MHVTMIAGTYQPTHCGVAHYTDRLRQALQHYRVESTILTTHAAAQTLTDPSVIGAVGGWQWPDLPALLRSLKSIRTDILHIQHAAGTYGFERAIFLFPLLLRALGWRRPIITTVHEYGWWEWTPPLIPPPWLEGLKTWGQQRGLWDREDGFLLTQSDAIITTNSAAEQVIQTRLPQLADRLHRIPIAANIEVMTVDRGNARHILRSLRNWPEDAEIIVFFGFLHPVKGLETLLAAFRQVLAVRPLARLLLIGGVESLALVGSHANNYWHQLHQLVGELELDDTVYLAGYQPPDVASCYLAGTDIGVLPFNHGITLKSGSLLTLMAHGLPVIATHSDPPEPDFIDRRIIQFVAPRDINGLASTLLQLLREPWTRAQMSEAGRNFVRNFEWNVIADRHLQVYQQVLHPNP